MLAPIIKDAEYQHKNTIPTLLCLFVRLNVMVSIPVVVKLKPDKVGTVPQPRFAIRGPDPRLADMSSRYDRKYHLRQPPMPS